MVDFDRDLAVVEFLFDFLVEVQVHRPILPHVDGDFIGFVGILPHKSQQVRHGFLTQIAVIQIQVDVGQLSTSQETLCHVVCSVVADHGSFQDYPQPFHLFGFEKTD